MSDEAENNYILSSFKEFALLAEIRVCERLQEQITLIRMHIGENI